MSKPKTLMIDEVQYVRADSIGPQKETEKQIVILQRGWVMVGDFSQDGVNCQLDNASIIRIWGTTKGLGELALGGPTSSTKLDPCGLVKFHELTIVSRLSVNEDKWQ